MKTSSTFAAACLAVTTVLSTIRPATAAVFAEVGDAGATPSTAQSASGGSLSAITGTIASATDADVFSIHIDAPSTFSASTVNAVTNATFIDTELFLFKADGTPIAFNDDDASGQVVTSRIAAGNSLTANLPAGNYLLAIAVDGNQPVNGPPANQLVFQQEITPTATYGPASGINPAVFANFNGNVNFDDSGVYQIDLTSTSSVPEPMAGLSIIAAAGLLLRRR